MSTGPTRAPAPPGALGLTSAEAAQRLADMPDAPRARGSRSYLEIVRSNTFTLFNLVLGALLVLTLTLGNPKDALFGGVIVANTLIGIVQEVRAKRVLDRLALLVAPRAKVWRDGALVELPVEEIAPGDAIRVEPGDQVIADGQVIAARGLTLDESILTGESDAVTKETDDRVLSGAYCLAGSGDYVAEAVGAESFAERLAIEARQTGAILSPLQQDINRILRITVAVMVPLALLLLGSLILRGAGAEGHRGHRGGGAGAAGPRGPGAADEPHLRGGRRAARAHRHPGAAPQRGREPRLGGHAVPGQDRHPDREPHRRDRARAGGRPGRGRVARGSRRARRQRGIAELDDARGGGGRPRRGGARASRRCRSRRRASGAASPSRGAGRWCSAAPTCSRAAASP